jgi:hypothetical protein
VAPEEIAAQLTNKQTIDGICFSIGGADADIVFYMSSLIAFFLAKHFMMLSSIGQSAFNTLPDLFYILGLDRYYVIWSEIVFNHFCPFFYDGLGAVICLLHSRPKFGRWQASEGIFVVIAGIYIYVVREGPTVSRNLDEVRTAIQIYSIGYFYLINLRFLSHITKFVP